MEQEELLCAQMCAFGLRNYCKEGYKSPSAAPTPAYPLKCLSTSTAAFHTVRWVVITGIPLFNDMQNSSPREIWLEGVQNCSGMHVLRQS
jgi:hypothetical protein